MWIDSHCHVTADRFDVDRDDVIRRAREAGVEVMIAIGAGYGLDDNQGAIDLAEAEEDVFATVGLHPHDARLWTDEGRERLERWLDHPRVVAVGECGLDYHYEHSPRDVQRRVFGEQVALARQKDLPVSIHVRDDGPGAYEELLDIWLAEGAGEVDGVLHCFSYADLSFAKRALDARLDISFSGILTFKNASDLREVAAALPLDRLLVETDAPFLAPEGRRGKRNEPAHVVRVGEVLAASLERSLEEVSGATTANARRFYRLPDDG